MTFENATRKRKGVVGGVGIIFDVTPSGRAYDRMGQAVSALFPVGLSVV